MHILARVVATFRLAKTNRYRNSQYISLYAQFCPISYFMQRGQLQPLWDPTSIAQPGLEHATPLQ